MSLNSMTGFARTEGSFGAARWHWEIRSVNGKGLDARFRLPPGLDRLDARFRTELARHIRRGNCQITLTVERTSETSSLRINREALRAVIDAISEISNTIATAPPQPEGILALRGVLEQAEETEETEEERAAFEDALASSFTDAVAALASARAEEGRKLEAVLRAQIDEIERLT